KMRTMSKNSLQAIALQAGLAKGSRLFTKDGQQQLGAAEMSPVMHWQREHWLQLMEPLNQQLLETMVWFKEQSKGDVSITRLRTHAYVMLLNEIEYAEFRHRAVPARLARRGQGPSNVPEVLIGQPASPDQ